jgi:hypothetical protein
MKLTTLFLSLAALCSGLLSAEDKFYKEEPVFHFTPDPKAASNIIGRLGPIGLSLDLRKPNFTMHIKAVEPGSPAAQTGKLQAGQIIESINGEVLKDIDPRVQLGNLITRIEATDGVVKLMVKDNAKAAAQPVEFKIPVLGAYSETWPVNCQKSDAIVKQMSAFLRSQEDWGWGAALFLLSTGEKEDLEAVRERFSGKLDTERVGFPWSIGYTGIAICEYYLKTGDKSVLPAIKARHDYLLSKVYNSGWMGRGGANFGYMAGGHLNAAGLHCVTFLLMAKECGVEVDEAFLKDVFRHLYRYAGRGNVAYGDQMPERGMVDNGKVGKLAFTLQAAANLSGKGEESVYAKARDISATKAFYSTSWLFHGHTGGGIGELWRGSSMGLVRDKRPEQYRSFMDERRWMYELARTHEGGFGWADGMNVGYTGVNTGRPCGNYIPLIFTLPRKQLRIFGAPATEFSHTYELPEPIWGTKTDEAFYSLVPGEYAPGKRMDISKEEILTDASAPIFRRLKSPDTSEEQLLGYALHIELALRVGAAAQIRERGLHHLSLQLLRSKDPRGRSSGILSVTGLEEPMTDEVAGLLIAMIEDEKESWWVVMQALQALKGASPEQLAPHVAAIEKWLDHDDWWLKASALDAALPLVTDPDLGKRLIPRIAAIMWSNQRPGLSGRLRAIAKMTQEADTGVQQLAKKEFADAYADYPELIKAPGGQDMSNGTTYMFRHMARTIAEIPGGLDVLYEVSKQRFPDAALPHKELYLDAEPSKLGDKLQASMKGIILDELIPEYIGKGHHPQSNRAYLLNETTSAEPLELNYYYREPRVLGLVDLYQRADVHDYDWRAYGPDKAKVTWDYHSFDPPEKLLWKAGARYRKVTLPEGMEQWFQPAFDAKSAGWKSGLAPIGQVDGKLAPSGKACEFDYCDCAQTPRSLWEHEVLLMRTRIDVPKFKEGHIYRLNVGGLSHNHAGDGLKIYVNGKPIYERKKGTPNRSGSPAICAYLDKTWWPEFGEDTTIAATSFLAIPGGRRSPGVRKGHIDIWIQEMKAPPMDRAVILKSATAVPMFSAEWQANQDPNRNSGEDDGMFFWDGKFVGDNRIEGAWTQLGVVPAIDAFQPGDELKKDHQATFGEIKLKPGGSTDDELMIWSGSTLMNLRQNEALQITPKTVDGTQYLFIETGGFNQRNGPEWKSPLVVMTRKKG